MTRVQCPGTISEPSPEVNDRDRGTPAVGLTGARHPSEGRSEGGDSFSLLSLWEVSHKYDPRGAALADRHYSRRKVGSPQFMPPGQTLVLVTPDGLAVWGWWRPHPRSGLSSMNGLDGWTCTLFRNEGPVLSSRLILAAEAVLAAHHPGDCGPDGMMTYIWDKKIRSTNPGWCYRCAGWGGHPTKPRSADKRKTLLCKPFALAGRAP